MRKFLNWLFQFSGHNAMAGNPVLVSSWQLLPVSVGTREAALHLFSLKPYLQKSLVVYFVESFLSLGGPLIFTPPPTATMDNMNLLLDLTSGVQMHFSETCQLEKSGSACILLNEREKQTKNSVFNLVPLKISFK